MIIKKKEKDNGKRLFVVMEDCCHGRFFMFFFT